MNQSTLTDAASTAAQKSKNFVVAQLERQAQNLGGTVVQTAHDLERIGSQLRESDTIGSAAQVADWAARYVKTVGEYLQSGSSEQFINDFENFSRERPWAVVATAATAGFAAARVIKSSSVRRFKQAPYVDSYADDYAYESSAHRPITAMDSI